MHKDIFTHLFQAEKLLLLIWLRYSDVTTCCSSLGSGILRFWESNLSGTIINSQTFFGKNPRKDLKEGPVYKAKGTTWPSRLKYIPGSVLTKTVETIVLTSNTIIYLTLCESIQISSRKWWLQRTMLHTVYRYLSPNGIDSETTSGRSS